MGRGKGYGIGSGGLLLAGRLRTILLVSRDGCILRRPGLSGKAIKSYLMNYWLGCCVEFEESGNKIDLS